jgi:FecR-like protein
MKRLLAIALILGVGLTVSYGQQIQKFATIRDDPIGKVSSVIGQVWLKHNSAIHPAFITTSKAIKIGDFIYIGDVIKLDFDARLNLAFVDMTTLTLERGAVMEINEFIYNPHGHKNESLMSLSQGTFNFIVGKIGHTGNMKVHTPVGTISVRGAPRVEILPDGDVKFSTMIEKK